MTTSQLIGNCTGHSDPDIWYPEFKSGPPSPRRAEALSKSIGEAIALCNTCSIQEACLAEGMKEDNLPYGIWGGKIAGERILSANIQGPISPQGELGKALQQYGQMQKYVEGVV